ncbi:MAG: hypothetical protein PF517_10965 [Salinivirgaceae bacterium]|nr:hypothetical protein [Salinivirgaceae bacterium]
MEKYQLDTLVKENKSANSTQFKFELPTRVTRLDPVFLLTFNIHSSDNQKNTVDIALNPKLAEQSNNLDLVKHYQFNSDGTFVFKEQLFSNYYLEGEMQLLDSDNSTPETNCFVSITYGNKDTAQHFIKGKFKLTE